MADEEAPNDEASSESNEETEQDGDVEYSSPDSATTVESSSSDSTEDESDSFAFESSHEEDSASSDTAGDDSVSSDLGEEETVSTGSSEGDSASSGSSVSESTTAELGSDTDSGSPESSIDTGSGSSMLESTIGSHSSESTADVMEGASPAEQAALKRVRAVSKLLDDAFPVPGTNYRIGLDPILGILPVAGDAIPTALSFYPIVEAYRLDVPKETLMKMLALVTIDATVGSVPVLGTVFDAFWKANKWNLQMLERHIQEG